MDRQERIDFFMAHAPTAPDSFKPVIRDEPKHPGSFLHHFGKGSNYPYRHAIYLFEDDADYKYDIAISNICLRFKVDESRAMEIYAEVERDIKGWNLEIDLYRRDHEEWLIEYAIQKQVQWAYRFALDAIDRVIKL